MKTVKKTYLIKAPLEKVWKALVDPKMIDDWGAGPAQMDDQAGTEFKLWGGDIFGKNVEVVANKKLVQDWFEDNWDQPSKVTFTLSQKNGKIKVTLLHENIPDSEEKEIDDGWDSYYLGPMKEYLEMCF